MAVMRAASRNVGHTHTLPWSVEEHSSRIRDFRLSNLLNFTNFLKFVKVRFGHFGPMGPFDWLFWCSTATN